MNKIAQAEVDPSVQLEGDEDAPPVVRATSTLAALPARTPAVPASDSDGAIRVLCVDDHEVLVAGLTAQLGLDPSIRVVGSLGSAARLVEVAAERKPHVVILDIEMPAPDVFEMADRLHRAMPRVRIIILSAHIRETFLAAAYRCGACGYFAKSDNPAEIARAVRNVAAARGAGEEPEFVLGAKVRERCLMQRPPDRRSRPRSDAANAGTRLSGLSDRELEVLRLIGKGLSRERIAEQLSRSVKTIDGHQFRIKEKLGLSTREDLMLLAIREGLAEVP